MPGPPVGRTNTNTNPSSPASLPSQPTQTRLSHTPSQVSIGKKPMTYQANTGQPGQPAANAQTGVGAGAGKRAGKGRATNTATATAGVAANPTGGGGGKSKGKGAVNKNPSLNPSSNPSSSGPGPGNSKIWSTSTTEERERIKEFWLNLSEDERRNLVKVEKDTVLRKMKEQQKHSCSCAVCGRKR